MKRARYLVLLFAVGGCRGVIGYHDLTLISDGGVHLDDAGNPIGPVDSGTNPPPDGGGPPPPPPDAGDPYASCRGQQLPQCMQCCRNAFGLSFNDLITRAKDGCLCGGSGTCNAECGNNWCMNPMSMPTGQCGPCIDVHLATACPSVTNACAGLPCEQAAGCVKVCQ